MYIVRTVKVTNGEPYTDYTGLFSYEEADEYARHQESSSIGDYEIECYVETVLPSAAALSLMRGYRSARHG